MFKILTAEQLLDMFRPSERQEVILPQELKFPLLVKDYFTWPEPSGARVYLLFSDRREASPIGIVFRRDQSAGSENALMCEWCQSVRVGDGVGLLTATATSKRRVGLNLCRDLSCKHKIAEAPGAHDFPIQMTPHEKLQRVIRRMGEFARRELF